MRTDTLDSEKLLSLISALDGVHKELLNDRYLGFVDDSEQRHFYYQRLQASRRNERIQQCAYPGCPTRSIMRSHTMPRGGPLELIAENGHVITPKFNVERGVLEANSIGIRDASTFFGFCQTHEQLFRDFEQQKRPAVGDEHVLQFFRLVCREIRARTLQLNVCAYLTMT
jgi:hypothetical protein